MAAPAAKAPSPAKSGSQKILIWGMVTAAVFVLVALLIANLKHLATNSSANTNAVVAKEIETIYQTISSPVEAKCGKRYVFTMEKGSSIALSDQCWATMDATKGVAELHLQNGRRMKIEPNLIQTLDSKVTDIVPVSSEVRIVVLLCLNGMKSTTNMTCV